MTRTPFALAALASAAVPGLDPVGVQTVLGGDDRFDTAIVADTDDRTWVIRAPRSEALAGQMDLASTYLALLARRVPFAVPLVRGWVDLKEGGRAAVSHLLPGERVDFAALPPGPGVTAELGRTIGTLHNVDPALAEEAGLSTYPADDYRRRRLAALDRAAATGHVPAALLTRWESALEDTALWHYHPVPVHGSLRSDNVLVTFTDPDDAATGTVKALTGWEDARVGDPADDFAALVAHASTEAVHAALEAYAHTRVERPDRNLLVRATLAAEMSRLSGLVAASAAGDEVRVQRIAAALAQLADDLADAEPLTQIQPRTRRRPVDVAAQAGDANAEVDGEHGAVETEFATTDDLADTDGTDGTGPVPAAGEMPADDVAADEVAAGEVSVDDDVTAPHPPVAPN